MKQGKYPNTGQSITETVNAKDPSKRIGSSKHSTIASS